MKTTNNRHAAFTLMELLATLAIIATLLGIAMPTMQAFMSRTSGQQGMHLLRESLLGTRELAMDSGENANWGTSQLSDGSDAQTLAQKGFVVQIVAGTNPIVFQPDGTATDAIIELTSPNNTLLGKILVIGSTGAILTADCCG